MSSTNQSSVSSVTKSAASLSAVVLAGGQSSRMGRDKALIEINGIPLLRQVCETALKCTNSVYVVSAWSDQYAPFLPSNVMLISEVDPQGPLIGFAQALTYISTDWVLLLACDMPQLNSSTLQQWVTGLNEVAEHQIALLPRSEKGWEPLCGFYRRSCLPALNTFIEQGGRSFQRWLESQPVQELYISDRQALFNCNTPEDLALFLRNGA